MLRYALIVICALSSVACTTTDPKSAAPAARTEASASDANRLVCRDAVSTTGSYGPRHVCHAKAQWDKIDAQDY